MGDGLRKLLRSGSEEWRIGVLNGPNISNLNRFARRRFGADIGITDLGELERWVLDVGTALGLACEWFNNDFEGEILHWVYSSPDRFDGIVVNPGGLTQFGGATRHALRDTGLPVIECHLDNLARHGSASIFAPTVTGSVLGFRQHSYAAALVAMAGTLDTAEHAAQQQIAGGGQ